jgi:hypothetical protein
VLVHFWDYIFQTWITVRRFKPSEGGRPALSYEVCDSSIMPVHILILSGPTPSRVRHVMDPEMDPLSVTFQADR